MNITIPKTAEKTIVLPTRAEILKGIMIIAMSRANMSGMYPLGIAFAASLPLEKAYIGLIGMSAGLAASGAPVGKYLIALFLYYAVIFIKKYSGEYAKAVVLGISVLASGALSFSWTGISRDAVLLLVIEAFLTGGILVMFSVLGEKSERGFLAALIAAGGVLNGVSDVFLPYINIGLAPFAAIFGIMCVCYACELPTAALAGGVLGLMTYMNQPQAVLMTGMLMIAAFFSALLSRAGKMGTAIGFLCGITISVLYTDNLDVLHAAELFGAFALFALIPESVHVKISAAILNLVTPEYEEPEINRRVSAQLKTVAKAVCDLADGVTFLSGKNLESARMREMFDTVSARVCKDCALEESCRRKNSRKTYESMYEIWQAMEEDGYCDHTNVPLGFRQVCVRSESFLREFNHVYELFKQDALYQGEALSGRGIIARQYSEISNVIRSLSHELDEGFVEDEPGKCRFSAAVSELQESKKGQAVCGDTLVHFERGNKYFVILCDGMGSGEAALSESRLTAKLFEEFLKAGFAKETAVSMINSALALKADKESFSTVDILEIDLETGVTEFLKIGSAQSFIKTKSEIAVISSKTAPVGILENVEAEVESRELKNGDMILMVSDGVSEAGDGVLKNEWIKKILSFDNRRDDEICRLIISGAKARMKFSDDMTCVIIRIKKNRE